MYLFDSIQITLSMTSGRISGGMFLQMPIWHKLLLNGGIFRLYNFKKKPCKQIYQL